MREREYFLKNKNHVKFLIKIKKYNLLSFVDLKYDERKIQFPFTFQEFYSETKWKMEHSAFENFMLHKKLKCDSVELFRISLSMLL